MVTTLIVPLSKKFFDKFEKNEKILKEAEELTLCNVEIDKQNLRAIIKAKDLKSDILKMRDFLISLSHGIDEENAFKIIKYDMILYIINLKNIFDSKDDIKRILGRIIGENGKIKQKISEITECSIYIDNSNIVLIGSFEDVEYAKQAIQILVDGSPHSRLFKFLDKVAREKRLRKAI